jgi:hypothetical protein
MNFHFITLALDAMPYLARHLPIFEESELDFTWHIVHGAAANAGSTRWCQWQQPRFSWDGSSEYINQLTAHPRVLLYQQQWWPGGKDEMVNAPLENIKDECALMQIDADEIWTPGALREVDALFSTGKCDLAYFNCRYFVGPDLITTGQETYGHESAQGRRAWKFKPGMSWGSHEPPVLNGNQGAACQTNITFDHLAYTLESQVLYKECFYGYKDALKHWKRLQENTSWPAPLSEFFPWAKSGTVTKL